MDHHRGVKVLFEVLNDLLGVLQVGLYQVNGRNPMQLLPGLLDVEIQSNIVLSEIFQFKKGRYHIMIGLVENDDFPNVFCL